MAWRPPHPTVALVRGNQGVQNPQPRAGVVTRARLGVGVGVGGLVGAGCAKTDELARVQLGWRHRIDAIQGRPLPQADP